MLSMLRNPTGRRGLRRPSGAGLADRRTSNEVLSIARDLLRGQVTMDMSLMEAGLDSFGAMEFQSRLSDRLGGPKLPATLIFDHPTLRQLEAYIAGEQESREQLATAKDGAQVGVPDAAMVADALKGLVAPSLGVAGAEEIATVRLTGASYRLPSGVQSERAACIALRSAADLVDDVVLARGWVASSVAAARENAQYAGVLRGAVCFDPSLFDVSRSESSAMDPQQRLLLEHGYEALHDSGEDKVGLHGKSVGVEVGVYATDFHEILMRSPAATGVYAATGAALSIASGRLSYLLGLRGPSVSVDTACSSALVALHYAANDLRGLAGFAMKSSVQNELHLAAGVNLMLVPSPSLVMAAAGMTSPTGRSHTFDRRANGFVRGEGCVAVTLAANIKESRATSRRPSAVLSSDRRGSGTATTASPQIQSVAVAQDGKSASLTAPNGQAQQQLLHAALRFAGSTRAELRSIEAHGTGTPLGDPIEAGSLKGALVGRDGGQPLVLGGVKGNSGHTESAAGLSGLQAVLLAHRHAFAAPNTQLRVLNPHVSSLVDGEKVLTLPVQLAPPAPPLGKGGVSSFGYSGTIAHALLRVCPGRGYTRTPPWAGRVAFHRESLAWPQRRSSKGARAASRDMMVSVRLSCLVDAAEVSTQELKPWTPRGGSFSLSLCAMRLACHSPPL